MSIASPCPTRPAAIRVAAERHVAKRYKDLSQGGEFGIYRSTDREATQPDRFIRPANTMRKRSVAAISSCDHSYAGYRRGVSLPLILILLMTYLVLVAIMINVAYMGLVKTEIRIATDAAAKAGAEALSRTENTGEAIKVAVNLASQNTVAGKPFRIRPEDVELGRLGNDSSGRWIFTLSKDRPNAVRVNSRTSADSLHGPISLFLSGVTGLSSFSPTSTATAGQQEVAVCLCLDRSGSMLFDMSGVDFQYPPKNPLLVKFTSWGTQWQNHLSPPNPVGSRWAILTKAVDLFLKEAEAYNPPPRVGLVTWASTYQMPVSPSTQFHASTVNVALPKRATGDWVTNRNAVSGAVKTLGQNPMMGATNLSTGLDAAVAVVSGGTGDVYVNKVVVLMTDGQWNEGRDPIAAGRDARDAGVIVHTVSMLTKHQPELEQIAAMTGGRHFATQNEQELVEAFREIARSLPIVLIE